ncbi:MAG: WD40 repeat domain-containing serine/threonine-protein kinase [Phycisphaerales bacterium]
MNAERRALAFALFDELCDLPEPERSAAVERRCADDPELREAVERMLRSDTIDHLDLPPGAGADLLAAGLAEESPAPTPERIGRYRVIREIGRGGMGVVYEAEQDEPKRRVAVKVIRDGIASREVVRRFQRESNLLARLHHPGIAQVFEAGTDIANGVRRSYYAMEHVGGLPIDRHADEHALTVEQRVELLARVCDAVQHAHQKGILHRDLKTANVLVATADDDQGATGTGSGAIDAIGQPKIVDFGIARLTEDTDGLTQHTHAGQIIGSLACMSPEQLAGDRDSVDTRTDVYAIGVMLYRVLSGRSPHDLTGMSIPEAARTVAEKEPRPLSSVDATLHGDLTVIVAKTLERDIERRYDSVAALGDDLRRTLRDEPIAARAQSRWYRARKFTRRHRAAVLSSVAALTLLIAAAVVSVAFGLRAVAAQQNAEITAVRADRAAYRAAISAAAAAIRDGDARLAREFLNAAPAHLRGWEWWYYQGRLDASVAHAASENPWLGETADFVFSACWLSEDGKVLHTASHYYDKPHRFESFDAATLRPLGHWVAGESQRCLGVDRERNAAIFYDATAGEIIVRDLGSGQAVERWACEPGLGLPWLSYDPLVANPDRLRDLTGREPWRPLVFPASLDAGATRWVTWYGRSPSIRSLDADQEPVALAPAREGVSRASFAPDGASVAVATLDRRVDLYDASTGRRLWGHAEAHDDAPMSIAFSPDAKVLATGGQDRVIKLWDTATGTLIGSLIGHDGAVVALAFSPDGQTLYSADGGAVRTWRVRDAADAGILVRHTTYAYGLALNTNGSAIVSRVPWNNFINATMREIILSEPGSDHPTRRLDLPPEAERVLDTAFVASDRLAVLAARSGEWNAPTLPTEVIFFEIPSGRLERVVDLGAMNAGRFNPLDDTLELTPSVLTVRGAPTVEIELTGMTPRVLDTPARHAPWLQTTPTLAWIDADDATIHDFGRPDSQVRSVFVDRERERAYVGTLLGVLHVLDLESGEQIAELETSAGSIEALAMLPDASRLFAGCADTTIRVLNPNTLELVAVLRAHRDTVNDLAVSPDGKTLYSASDDYTVRMWTVTR